MQRRAECEAEPNRAAACARKAMRGRECSVDSTRMRVREGKMYNENSQAHDLFDLRRRRGGRDDIERGMRFADLVGTSSGVDRLARTRPPRSALQFAGE